MEIQIRHRIKYRRVGSDTVCPVCGETGITEISTQDRPESRRRTYDLECGHRLVEPWWHWITAELVEAA